MLFDWTDGALAEGLRCYCHQEFFDAHEHWEGVWLKCDEPQKTFLQALIQITAAFHHLQRGNLTGTASLLRRALRRLDGFPAEFNGVAVEELRTSVRAWLLALQKALESDPVPPQLPFPHIR
jgi:predicted metal-dependent hydrolase